MAYNDIYFEVMNAEEDKRSVFDSKETLFRNKLRNVYTRTMPYIFGYGIRTMNMVGPYFFTIASSKIKWNKLVGEEDYRISSQIHPGSRLLTEVTSSGSRVFKGGLAQCEGCGLIARMYQLNNLDVFADEVVLPLIGNITVTDFISRNGSTIFNSDGTTKKIILPWENEDGVSLEDTWSLDDDLFFNIIGNKEPSDFLLNLINQYDYYRDIYSTKNFKSCVLPTGALSEVLTEQVVDDNHKFYVFAKVNDGKSEFQNPEPKVAWLNIFIIMAIKRALYSKYGLKWQKLWDILQDYKPINDVDITEVETPNVTIENTNSTYGFNSGTKQPNAHSIGTETGTRTRRRSGTMGEKQQETVMKEYELQKNNFFNIVMKDIADLLTQDYYEMED